MRSQREFALCHFSLTTRSRVQTFGLCLLCVPPLVVHAQAAAAAWEILPGSIPVPSCETNLCDIGSLSNCQFPEGWKGSLTNNIVSFTCRKSDRYLEAHTGQAAFAATGHDPADFGTVLHLATNLTESSSTNFFLGQRSRFQLSGFISQVDDDYPQAELRVFDADGFLLDTASTGRLVAPQFPNWTSFSVSTKGLVSTPPATIEVILGGEFNTGIACNAYFDDLELSADQLPPTTATSGTSGTTGRSDLVFFTSATSGTTSRSSSGLLPTSVNGFSITATISGASLSALTTSDQAILPTDSSYAPASSTSTAKY